MRLKTKISEPAYLAHPPAPLGQETDTPYVLMSVLVAGSLLTAGLLFHPAPDNVGIGLAPAGSVTSGIEPPPVAGLTHTKVTSPANSQVVAAAKAFGTAVTQVTRAGSADGSSGESGSVGSQTITRPAPAPKVKTGLKSVDDLEDNLTRTLVGQNGHRR